MVFEKEYHGIIAPLRDRQDFGSCAVGIKSDRWIEKMATRHGMIEPFVPELVRGGVVSFGLSSYGYDIRIADEFRVFSPKHGRIVDPKNFDPDNFVDFAGPECTIPPNSFCLARSLEYFRIPRDVIGICLGKSTYARCGIVVNITPLEPEWEGHLTIGISNTTPLPAKLYAGEGIAQLIFIEAAEITSCSYGDRKGKYQAQKGVVPPRIDAAEGESLGKHRKKRRN